MYENVNYLCYYEKFTHMLILLAVVEPKTLFVLERIIML